MQKSIEDEKDGYHIAAWEKSERRKRDKGRGRLRCICQSKFYPQGPISSKSGPVPLYAIQLQTELWAGSLMILFPCHSAMD